MLSVGVTLEPTSGFWQDASLREDFLIQGRQDDAQMGWATMKVDARGKLIGVKNCGETK